jgi:predicted AAA+ superfamily ATPase
MYERRLERVCRQLLAEEAVLAIEGPRTVGKSTLLRALAATAGVEVLDFDDPATRQAAEADPVTIASGPAPVCIDEYQHVPAVLPAIKAELNRNLRPGRFILTGSTSSSVSRRSTALTGRLHIVKMLPLSQGEILGRRELFLERFLTNPAALVQATDSNTTREDYIARIVAGGLPMPLQRTGRGRERWFDDYVRLTIERDVPELAGVHRPDAFSRFLAALVSQTAQVLNISRAAAAVRLDESTGRNYLRLLESVFLVDRLPAWGTTLRSRTVHAPKIHALDTGIAARLLRLTEEKLAARNAAAMSQFGNLLESFTVGEIRKQASWLDQVSVLGHWRLHDGSTEVDLVVGRPDGKIVAFEVKASRHVDVRDAIGLQKLQRATAANFHGGAVLHLGTRSFKMADSIYAIPLDSLWLA